MSFATLAAGRSLCRSALSVYPRRFAGAAAAASTSSSSTEAALDSKKLEILKTTKRKEKVENDKLLFGHTFTDHMLEISWKKEVGWGKPKISPYHPLQLDPAAVVLHYASEIFEGMKAYVDTAGHARLFRPDLNMRRLNNSAHRLFLPTFDEKELLQCIKQLVIVDKEWIPRQRGYSLYIRPTMIATTPYLGVGPAADALLYVILSPVGPYYKTGFAPVRLLAQNKYVRAWPGGTGEAKCGGNYAPGIRPQVEANQKGYQQILWLFGKEDHITEVGTMNFFVYWINEKTGKNELVTAPLDGTILHGVTRASIIDLARKEGITVTERAVPIAEILAAQKQKRLHECFGAGTAAIVSPVKCISYNGVDYTVPLGIDDQSASGAIGPLAKKMVDQIMAIQYGEERNHPWSVQLD